MPVFTYETALNTMQDNPAIEDITYSIKNCCDGTTTLSLQREDDCIWHICEFTGADTSTSILVWKRLVHPTVCFRGDLMEPLPAPCSPLTRQVATGYVSPCVKPTLRITLPASSHTSPASGCLAPVPLLSPLVLSRQTSTSLSIPEGDVTGINENTHIFFGEDGNEISKEEHVENTFNLMMHLSPLCATGPTTSFRHPRVLLFYLRFVAVVNEGQSTPQIPWPVLSVSQRAMVNDYICTFPPATEFEDDVKELFALMEKCPYS